MGWATKHIHDLSEGLTVQFRPRGNSMTGRVNNGDLVTVVPATVETVEIDDIVLCKVAGSEYLHLVKAKDSLGRVQIGNNHGRVNGWTKAVYGKCIKIET